MVSFLDLSTASEEERRLIREILSDTSVVNFVSHHHQQQPQHQVVQRSTVASLTSAATLTSASASTTTTSTNTTTITTLPSNANNNNINNNNNNNVNTSINATLDIEHQRQHQQLATTSATSLPAAGLVETPSYTSSTVPSTPSTTTTSVSAQQSIVPTSTQSTPPTNLPNDMNSSVIRMDLTSTQQPPSYAMPPPPHPSAHVTAFGPAPPAQIYGGAPIFQAYPYFIPYNLPPYGLPPYGHIMPSTNNVVPTRQQAPPQSNQPTGSSNDSHSRSSHHSSHQQQHLNQNQSMHQQHQHQHQQHQPQHHHSNSDHHHHHHHHQQHNGHNNNHNRANQRHEIMRDNETNSINTNTNKSPGDIDPVIVNNSSVSPPSRSAYKNLVNNRIILKTTAAHNSSNYASVKGPANDLAQDLDTLGKGVAPAQISSDNLDSNSNSSFVSKNSSHTESFAQTKTETPEDLTRIQLPNPTVSSTNQANSTCPKVDLSQVVDSTQSKDLKKSDTNSFAEKKAQSNQAASQPTPEINSGNQPTQAKSDQDDSSASTMPDESIESSPAAESIQQEKPASVWNSASSKSWADLFRRDGQASGQLINGEDEHNNARLDNMDIPKNQKSTPIFESNCRNALLMQNTKEQRSHELARRAMDKLAPQLAQRISSYTLKHACPNLRPRGFINRGNGCYINSTLQALIACPPFYNLMREVAGDTKTLRRENSCTPILDSFTELFQNFPPLLDSSKKNKQSSSGDQRIPINQLQAEAIEPKCIYNVLGHIKKECLKGAQEDAEEFLSSVLNGLDEEMRGLGEILQNSTNQNGHYSDNDELDDDVANDDNLWREVGAKNRSLPIRTTKVVNTPIQEIFGGSLFSIRTAGKDRCGHRSPFFALQLDISGDNVKTLQDAIKSFTAPEIINDFYCSKTKQTLDAQRKTSLDLLPPILILHLKQFVYTQDHGLRKVMKKIEYPIDFELPEYCLHEKTSIDRSLRTSRAYKLLAVVYHEGKEAVKGHYLTDIYHIGSSQWIRCDDSNLKVVASPRIESSDSTRTPYLLIYRRLNTLRLPMNNHEVKRKP